MIGCVPVVRNPRCLGIVIVHRDLSLTCTQDPCSVTDRLPPSSDAWLFAHSSYYGCDFVLGQKCPRCGPMSKTRSPGQLVADRGDTS